MKANKKLKIAKKELLQTKNEMLNDFLFNLFTQEPSGFNFDPFKQEIDQNPIDSMIIEDESMGTILRANSAGNMTGQNNFTEQSKYQTSERKNVAFTEQKENIFEYEQDHHDDHDIYNNNESRQWTTSN